MLQEVLGQTGPLVFKGNLLCGGKTKKYGKKGGEKREAEEGGEKRKKLIKNIFSGGAGWHSLGGPAAVKGRRLIYTRNLGACE